MPSGSAALSELIAFPQSIPQVAGVEYAIVVNYLGAPPPGPMQAQGEWVGTSGDAYSGGDLVFSRDGGVSWSVQQPKADVHFKTFINPPVIAVGIDIKPGGLPNTINTASRGKIPVAILSSAPFSALDKIKIDSLTFGRTGSEPSLAFCNAISEDVNEDGIPDLVCHFNTQQTGFHEGDTAGVLKAKTFDDDSVIGTDSVRVVR